MKIKLVYYAKDLEYYIFNIKSRNESLVSSKKKKMNEHLKIKEKMEHCRKLDLKLICLYCPVFHFFVYPTPFSGITGEFKPNLIQINFPLYSIISLGIFFFF